MNVSLWKLLFSKVFFAITLTLGSLRFGSNKGWLSPTDWLLGIVQEFRVVTKSLTDLCFQWIPLDNWSISQVESDDIWLASITFLPPTLAVLRTNRVGSIVTLSKMFFLAFLVIGLPAIVISSGLETKETGILDYMDTRLEYIHFAL